MNHSKISLLNSDFVVYTDHNFGSFIDEKVILRNSTNQSFGVVVQIDSKNVTIQVLQSLDGFDLETTQVIFTGKRFRLDLSPTILGRRFDFAGNTIDNLGSILPLESQEFEFKKKSNLKSKSISFQKHIVPNLVLKGESILDPTQNYLEILEEMNQDNIAIVVVGKVNHAREKLMQQTGLDQVAVWFEYFDSNKKMWKEALEMGFVAGEYIAKEFQFDVLILVDGWRKCEESFGKRDQVLNHFCKPAIEIESNPKQFLSQTFVSNEGNYSLSLLGVSM